MIAHEGWRLRMARLVLVLCVCGWPASAAAQSVGTGPLTTTLSDTEPTTGTLTLGRIKLAPGLVIRELGWDSNVFDERDDPKEDHLASIAPDVAVFMRLRFLQLSGYAGMDFNYFKHYESERSIGQTLKARTDLLMSRVKPFVGVGRTETRLRPNGEIDVRANRVEDEFSGGISFDLSAHSLLYTAAYDMRTEFKDAFERGINLGESLNRNRREYSVGLRTDLTPLAAVTVYGAYGEDDFKDAPLRNGKSWGAITTLRIKTEAVVTGVVTLGYRNYQPVDPNVKAFRGLTGIINLMYPFLEIGRLNLVATRGTEYSFDVAEAYYVENSVSLSYTHRLFGALDAQARGGRSLFDYGYGQGLPPHQDTLDTATGSVGYNLPNRTRLSLNYEYSRRRSPVLPARNYERRRAFLAWTFAF